MPRERNTTLMVNPRAELERAEALGRGHEDEAALTAAERVRLVAERMNDAALFEDAQLVIERLTPGVRTWRDSVRRRHDAHEANEVWKAV